ncbi:DUF2970 domain-containing protein [Glaciecola sp. KUL10]|uniref:DUF2970 domain-containing protein n=1 Tax=Glaciecola sp. (strain KUL10) TaxID=2161813 RepID=UPI000D789B63|nr:DUF2970 domain-containing protein [Glaciecola sp. KUL10]GBL03752.1 hypothetical protein KUL10_10520 [Glaciecola sp. KUL10]
MSANKWKKAVKSVISSFLGVQSQRNYEEDFTESPSPLPFIVVGVVFVTIFVLSLIALVSLVS